MNEDQIVTALYTMFGGAMLLMAGIAFWAAAQTWSLWPALAGVAALWGAYVGFRIAAQERVEK